MARENPTAVLANGPDAAASSSRVDGSLDLGEAAQHDLLERLACVLQGVEAPLEASHS